MWKFGLIAALLPEAVSIIRFVFSAERRASDAVLHALSAIALISAIGFIDVFVRLWKVDRSMSKFGNIFFTFISVIVAIIFTFMANYYQDGLDTDVNEPMCVFVVGCTAFWIFGEAWLANKFGQWKNYLEK